MHKRALQGNPSRCGLVLGLLPRALRRLTSRFGSSSTSAIAPTTQAAGHFRLGTLQQRHGLDAEGAELLRRALEIDLAHRGADDPVLRFRLAVAAWELMAKGVVGAREALPLIEMALATDQVEDSERFAEAEAKDMGRLMAVCLAMLVDDGDGADDFGARARRVIHRFGLDSAAVEAEARELRDGALPAGS